MGKFLSQQGRHTKPDATCIPPVPLLVPRRKLNSEFQIIAKCYTGSSNLSERASPAFTDLHSPSPVTATTSKKAFFRQWRPPAASERPQSNWAQITSAWVGIIASGQKGFPPARSMSEIFPIALQNEYAI